MSNQTIETMIRRRSVRTYRKEQITDEELALILSCALYAPTGKNCQTSRFIVIQEPEVMDELNAVIKRELAGREIREGQWMNAGILRARKEHYAFAHGAPTLITAVAPADHDNSMANCACALENIQLAAASLGIGACWSNQGRWLTGCAAVRAIFERYGMREDEDIYGSIGLGYPASEPGEPLPRKAGRILLDRERPLELL